MDVERDAFLTWVIDANGVMYRAAMTPLQVASAIFGNCVELTMEGDLQDEACQVLVYLSLYKEIAHQMQIRDEILLGDDEDEDEDEVEVEGYVKTFAQLLDGRFVEIGVEFKELQAFNNRAPNQTEFMLSYRTSFCLGEKTRITQLLIPIEVAFLLDGRQFFLIETN